MKGQLHPGPEQHQGLRVGSVKGRHLGIPWALANSLVDEYGLSDLQGWGEWHWGCLEQPEEKLLLQELRDDSEGDL